MHKSKSGFTLVELLIVIVIIAILAAITIVSYNGIQSRARDSKRKSDVAQIAKLLTMYEIDNGPMFTGSGCGNGGNGSGYFNAQNTGAYPKSMMNCLIDAGLTKTEIADDKASCSGLTCQTYMKASCEVSGKVETYVFAHLETVKQTGTDTDNTCPNSNNYDTSYGMNYYVKVN